MDFSARLEEGKFRGTVVTLVPEPIIFFSFVALALWCCRDVVTFTSQIHVHVAWRIFLWIYYYGIGTVTSLGLVGYRYT